MNQIREQFAEINGRFLSAKKAVRERERILSVMASIDEALAREKQEMEAIMAQLQEAQATVAALQGTTWTAIWNKLIGDHEAELIVGLDAVARLQAAQESTEITIRTNEEKLQALEASLLPYADSDEQLAAVYDEQEAFLVANGRLPTEEIHKLNSSISSLQHFLPEAAEAILVGHEALKTLTELREEISDAKKVTLFKSSRRLSGPAARASQIQALENARWSDVNPLTSYFGMGRIVSMAGQLQPLFDQFQAELADLNEEMTVPPNLEVPQYFEVMYDWRKANEFERTVRISKWRRHLDRLDEQIRQKVAFLISEGRRKQPLLERLENKLQTLIEKQWQEAKHE